MTIMPAGLRSRDVFCCAAQRNRQPSGRWNIYVRGVKRWLRVSPFMGVCGRGHPPREVNSMAGEKSAAIGRVALIGNYPPRLCGIATFTFDVHQALAASFPDMAVDVYAMEDPGSDHAYPEAVTCTIAQDDLADYRAAAHRINTSGADVVLVQHEYGIFGGEAGVHLLRLLERVAAPVVVTLHTVLEAPNEGQRAVLDALARRASKLIVMAEKGREILEQVNGVASEKIAVVPHGVPDRPFVPADENKARFDFTGRDVLLTFGLLSPNKGIETMIRA
ncbi:MAG: glycosyltransferase, partial [Sphingomonas sp.]